MRKGGSRSFLTTKKPLPMRDSSDGIVAVKGAAKKDTLPPVLRQLQKNGNGGIVVRVLRGAGIPDPLHAVQPLLRGARL